MKCNTRDFSEIEIEQSDIIEFIQPPFGFEEYKKYVLIHDKDVGDDIAWLQSIDEPSVCFFLFDPSSFSSFYMPVLSPSVSGMMGDGELVAWVIGVLPSDFSGATVNLKSPIIININTNRAAQIILEQDYPIRHPLMKGEL